MLLELCIVIQCDVIKQNEPKFRLHHIFIFFFWLYWPDKLQYFKTTKKISFHLAIMFQITILESSSSFLLDHSMYVPFATKYWLLWVIDIKLHENATDLQIYLSNRTVFPCNFTLHFKTWSHTAHSTRQCYSLHSHMHPFWIHTCSIFESSDFSSTNMTRDVYIPCIYWPALWEQSKLDLKWNKTKSKHDECLAM